MRDLVHHLIRRGEGRFEAAVRDAAGTAAPERNRMTTMMDTLLSPRRRTVLQAMAAASLLAACGDRRVGACRRPGPVASGPGNGLALHAEDRRARAVRVGGRTPRALAVAAALERVEAAMSTYRPASGTLAVQRPRRRNAVRGVARNACRVCRRAEAPPPRAARSTSRSRRRSTRRAPNAITQRRARFAHQRHRRSARAVIGLTRWRSTPPPARWSSTARGSGPTCPASPRATAPTPPRARSTRWVIATS